MRSIDIMKCKLVRESEIEYDAVKTPEDAAGVFISFGLGDSADEIFAIACLAADGSITAVHEISHGDITSSPVHPREIMKRALLNNAVSIVLGHCHPSMNPNPKPSQEDRDVTSRIVEAGKLMGVPVLDHIIISGTNHFSFRDAGLM